MRLAKKSRTILPLAFSAVLAACAMAQDHPNIQPNPVRDQLQQSSTGSKPQANSPAAASSPSKTLTPSAAKLPVKTTSQVPPAAPGKTAAKPSVAVPAKTMVDAKAGTKPGATDPKAAQNPGAANQKKTPAVKALEEKA